MWPARTRRPHRRPGPPAGPLRGPPSGPVPAAAVAPAGSLDSFCPLIDLATIISDNGRDQATRHAEKPYVASKVRDLPGCYVRSSGVFAVAYFLVTVAPWRCLSSSRCWG